MANKTAETKAKEILAKRCGISIDHTEQVHSIYTYEALDAMKIYTADLQASLDRYEAALREIVELPWTATNYYEIASNALKEQ